MDLELIAMLTFNRRCKMSKKIGNYLVALVLVMTLIGFTGSATAQDKPADNMDIVKEKIRSDKKLFIATNMQLTESAYQG